jgi:hypothetical protein
MVFGVLTALLRRGSITPLGNFTSKRGNKNFYKGRGAKRWGNKGHMGETLRSVRLPVSC